MLFFQKLSILIFFTENFKHIPYFSSFNTAVTALQNSVEDVFLLWRKMCEHSLNLNRFCYQGNLIKIYTDSVASINLSLQNSIPMLKCSVDINFSVNSFHLLMYLNHHHVRRKSQLVAKNIETLVLFICYKIMEWFWLKCFELVCP